MNKIIDQNGRLFGKVSVIDLLVVLVVLVMAFALHIKNNELDASKTSSDANVTITFTVKVENWRAEIELMGVHIELNCEHGNGNQIFDRESWSWFDAKDQVCEVTATRENGGDLVFTLVGQGSHTPVVITKTAVNESDQNLYLGVIDATGSAFFHGFEPSEVDNGEPGQNPGEDPGKNPDAPPKTGDPVWAVIALLIVSAQSLTALINKKSLHR